MFFPLYNTAWPKKTLLFESFLFPSQISVCFRALIGITRMLLLWTNSTSNFGASLVAQLVKNAVRETWVGKIPWRRERLPTPVFWPREFHGLFSPWARKELDTTEWLSLRHSILQMRKPKHREVSSPAQYHTINTSIVLYTSYLVSLQFINLISSDVSQRCKKQAKVKLNFSLSPV